MKSIHKIINEELISFLSENDELSYEFFEAEDSIKEEIFGDFLWHNNQDFTKNISWQLIPYLRLKKIWEGYMKMGSVRDVKGLDAIERIIIRNSLRINVITALAGHTQWGDEEAIEDNIGVWVNDQLDCIIPVKKIDTNQLEIPYDNPDAGHKQKESVNDKPCRVQIHPFAQKVIDENYDSANIDREDAREKLMDAMKERFFDYYLTDPKTGHLYISDYGLTPIMTQANKLYAEQISEKKVVLIDSILNVVHQRSDLASWFVQGGSAALSDLSGYEIPDEEAGGYDTKSAISGRYNMADYS